VRQTWPAIAARPCRGHRIQVNISIVQRKLTVIVSADVIGYTAMMERNEAGTLQRLMANRKSIFDPHVTTHGGAHRQADG
jgi:class 3 adenylate cyclase